MKRFAIAIAVVLSVATVAEAGFGLFGPLGFRARNERQLLRNQRQVDRNLRQLGINSFNGCNNGFSNQNFRFQQRQFVPQRHFVQRQFVPQRQFVNGFNGRSDIDIEIDVDDFGRRQGFQLDIDIDDLNGNGFHHNGFQQQFVLPQNFGYGCF